MATNRAAYRSTALLVLAVAILLSIPLMAMQFTDEVSWTPGDFIVAGILLLGTGLAYQWLARRSGHAVYRAAVAVALGSALFLVWSNLAVGLIGSEDNPANLLYLGVLGVGILGLILSRLEPAGMARTMWAMALVQAAIAAIALVLRLGGPTSGPVEILGVNGLFVALFAGCAALFRVAGRGVAEVREA